MNNKLTINDDIYTLSGSTQNNIIIYKTDRTELLRIDLDTGILTVSEEMKNYQVEEISRQFLDILNNSIVKYRRV